MNQRASQQRVFSLVGGDLNTHLYSQLPLLDLPWDPPGQGLTDGETLSTIRSRALAAVSAAKHRLGLPPRSHDEYLPCLKDWAPVQVRWLI